ncbi:MAG TPA: isopeptide-forming domain-containing fimbrial protein, partial [Pyrinomonadaceae bacterium]|nr:isopeptide-forming domain-containing fimbrial protein [Pyrinomonadaceae bacterium]
MLTGKLNRNVLPLILLLALTLTAHKPAFARPDEPATEAGTVISNRAEATYVDDDGQTFSTVSPTITLTILAVSTLKTTPDETSPSATVGPNEQVTRLFHVCNTGNTPDLYTITRAEVSDPAALVRLYFDVDASGTVTNADQPVNVGVSLSPRVAPGACIGVLAEVDTKDYPANSNLTIRLTARSNVVNSATGQAEDDGTIINAVGAGAKLTDPGNTSLPPVKLVNGNAQAVVSPGAPFTYSIAFRNSGDAPARGVVISDDLPAQLNYVGGTLHLDDRTLSDANDADEGYVQGNRVSVQLAEVVPGQVVRINFKATLNGNAPSGEGVTNVANLSAQNAALAKSTTAVVVVDPFGTVFAGRGGSAAPIPGARVEILIDQNGSTLGIPEGVGFDPNTSNTNPYSTDTLGHFSFALTQDQLGSEASPARYFMRVTADGYTARMLELTAHPTQAGLFALMVHALDGQALARAGGFDLVHEDVSINDMAAVALNIPMFEQHGLEITKMADQQRVQIGDAVSYRIEIHNPTAGAVNDVMLHDTLPVSFNYVAGTARLTLNSSLEQPIEPEITGNDLVFRIGTIAPGTSARLVYRVRVGANAREGNQENVAVASGTFSSGERTQTSPARATVAVGAGVFSNRQIIVGRVFVDMNGNGKFDDGDRAVPNVRLYLSSGQSVITDSQGLYSFPAINEGPQVLSLDPVTLPERYALADDGTLSSRSWTRMLRTPLGGGAMFRQNFVLTPSDAARRNSSASSFTGEQPSVNQQAGHSAQQPAVQTAATNNESHEPTASGTYEFVSTERVTPVEPGEVQIVSPEINAVVMTPAMQLDARVAIHWTVKLEVNGKQIPSTSIGTTRQDAGNQVTTYTFVGIDLRPGPNTVRVTPVDPNGVEGRSREITVMGRGPARRIEIVPERREVQAGGHDSVVFRVRAFDQWNNPAADDQIAIDTSAGNLLRINTDGTAATSSTNNWLAASVNASAMAQPSPSPQANQQTSQMIVQTRGGEAVLKLVGPGAPGEARLHALAGRIETQTDVRITPEMRSPILVGLAEVSVGQSLPQAALQNDDRHTESRLSFYFSGRIWHDNVLTLAYDSNRPINRTAGRNRLFQQDPLDRAYPLLGDSSTRFDAAPSNSKLYARLDHNRSYAMFGDFEADMEDLALAGYSRKLTGVKVHVENSQGDFVTVTGARPDTAFARDVFPAGGLSLLRLSHGEILEGSETVTLEVRDRRNPETILSRETLTRSIDYNLDPFTGEIFFLRYISAFDYDLNLAQIVVTYEHNADSLSSAVYTTRVKKTFAGIGLQLGFAGVMQRQEETGSFYVGGLDAEQRLPHNGRLRLAYARSQGDIAGGGNYFDNGLSTHDGSAYMIELQQPLPTYEVMLRARYAAATEGFFNPF